MMHRATARLPFANLFTTQSATLFATLLVGVSLVQAADEATSVNPPVNITIRTVRNFRVSGQLVSYDAKGFEYTNVLNMKRRLAWSDVNAQTDYLIHQKITPKDDAKAWFKLGQRLLKREDGERYGKEALDAAVRLDAKLREHAETVKKNPDAEIDLSPPPPPTSTDPDKATDEDAPPPVPVFKGNARPWKMLEPTRVKGVVETLKVMAASHEKKLGIKFKHTESDYFLIYTDLPITQVSKYATLLDRTDRTLSSMFQLPRNAHVWYGKATVFIFGKRDNYEAFEKKLYFTRDLTGDTSLHRRGDGSVLIACHRKADGDFFDDQLVRVATEGYLYRFISNLRLAAWFEQGLAGHVAQKLVPRGPTTTETSNTAVAELLRKNNMKLGETFFTARKLDPWQQNAAIALVTHMAQRNEKPFAAFTTALKAGYTWQVSLEQFYEKPEADLLKQWGNTLGVGTISR